MNSLSALGDHGRGDGICVTFQLAFVEDVQGVLARFCGAFNHEAHVASGVSELADDDAGEPIAVNLVDVIPLLKGLRFPHSSLTPRVSRSASSQSV